MSNITPLTHEDCEAQISEELTQKSKSAIHHSCAFCPSPILATAEGLRWAGWQRRGDYWVCPDCAMGVLA